MSKTQLSRKRDGFTHEGSTGFAVIRAILLGMVLGVFCMPAFAVDNNGAFELEGNALDGAAAGDDWETLYGGGGAQTVFTFITDKNGTDDIFTGGGSKTPNDPEDWLWKTSPPPPDKDNITHAYAANYSVGSKQVVYFGADLFATNGDAELAFWFFQDAVGPNALGGFDGHHVEGDVYVAVKFSNGGTQANITVYEWYAACNKADRNVSVVGACAADNIRVVIPQTAAVCNPGDGINPKACAITNTGNTASPWPYTPKSGTANVFAATAFFEGGINIFDTFGANKCFSSYMASTGASTSFTATAKDFALGEFNVCSSDVTKTCVNDDPDDDAPGAISYNVRGCGINDGGGPLNIISLKNSIGGAAQYVPSDLEWYVPGQVDNGAGGLREFDAATDCGSALRLSQAIADGTLVTDLANEDVAAGDALLYEFSETTSVNGPSDTVTLDAAGTDGTDIADATASATCPQRTFSASLNVTKQCAADLVDAGTRLEVKINVQGQVCNTGEVQLTGLTLVDTVASGVVTLNPLSTTLEPAGDAGGNDCTSYDGYYYPSSIPSGDICPFMDQVTATAIAPVNSAGEGCTLLGNGTSECTADSNSATCNLRATNDDNDCSTGPLSALPD